MTPHRTPREAPRHRQRRATSDGGSVTVEFALVLPLIITLVFGLVEFGMAWRQTAIIDRGAASAARIASSLGDAPMTDYEALRAVDAALASTSSVELERVVIYDATVNDGELPPVCDGPGGSVAAVCNVYTPAQAATESPVGFPRGMANNPQCVGGSWDAAWCPMDRRRERPDPDAVGVHIEARYDSVTRMLPGGQLGLSHSAAFLLEPPRIGD